MASSETGIVLAAIGYFISVGTLLGLSGVTGVHIELPGDYSEEKGSVDQSFTTAVIECLFTFFTDCNERTETKTFSAITDALSFAGSYLSFFFQLLTFQLPIPFILNSIIVLPGATAFAYVGLRFIRGGG